MKKHFQKIFWLLWLPALLFSQSDSSAVLTIDQLTVEDVKYQKAPEKKAQIVSASRSLKDVNDLPFTIKIITKEEIRNNGYTTLVDILKMAPGIRVSQPGSAIEGETFLMRGLQGNSYAKILINGNPVKPSVVSGMPIGAQLPIQQAERIEIIYGIAGTLFGADASAGIINIILEETERPIYTQANLSLGSQEFSNLDIFFGGKIGKEKNIVRYSLFGSYTTVANRKTIYDIEKNYNPQNYFSNIDLATISNYVGTDSVPFFNSLPHESRLLGMNLSYRDMTFSAQVMFRRDHSSIGLNPLSISYANPLNYTGERIINTNYTFEKDFKKTSIKINASYLQYLLDSRSSYRYVNNSTSRLLDELTFFSAFDLPNMTFDEVRYDSLTNLHFDKYFDGTRFSFAESHDLRVDFLFHYFPTEKFEMTFGITPKLYRGVPIINYSKVPLGSSFFSDNEIPTNSKLTPFPKDKLDGRSMSAFTQFYWNLKRFKVFGGLHYYFYEESLRGDNFTNRSFDPRLGVVYNFTERFSVRGSVGTAFRAPSSFYRSYTHNISLLNPNQPIEYTPTNLQPETTVAYELGFRWGSGSKINSDIMGFYTKTNNFISYILDVENGPNGPIRYIQGYFNSSNSNAVLYGFQVDVTLTELNINQKRFIDVYLSYTYSFGSERIADYFGNGLKLKAVREQPQSIRKARYIIYPTKKITLTIDRIVMTKSLNKVVGTGRDEIPKHRIHDVLINYQLNRNFRLYLKVRNVFNKEYAGLNATGTFDDLIYNPQEKRTFRFGMNYRLN